MEIYLIERSEVRQQGAGQSDGISMRDQQEESTGGGQCDREEEFTRIAFGLKTGNSRGHRH